jgi:hypothetical protein
MMRHSPVSYFWGGILPPLLAPVAAAATATVATTAAVSATTTTTLAGSALLGLVDLDLTSIDFLVVHLLNGLISSSLVGESDEAEATAAAGLEIHDHLL